MTMWSPNGQAPTNNPPTWGWADILAASNETDAALRRKLQRNQVRLETAASDDARTRATLWDIARLRVSRHLCDIGFDAERAFDLAKFLVDLAYKHLIDATNSFTMSAGDRQEFIFAVFYREAIAATGPSIIRLNPNGDKWRAGLEEIGLQATNPRNVIVPLHQLVLDAWSLLPDLPGDVKAWMDASSAKMKKLQSGEGD